MMKAWLSRCTSPSLAAGSSQGCTTGISGRSRARSCAVSPAATRPGQLSSAPATAGSRSHADYRGAIDNPRVDAVVVAVPPRFHLDLTLQALAAGKHVLVEKPAFLRMADYEAVRAARDRAGRVVLVGENDHYKPLAVVLRRLLADRRSATWCLRTSRPSSRG